MINTESWLCASCWMHCGPEQPKILGHSLVYLLVCSLRLLVRLLCTTRSAHALRLRAPLRSLAFSFIHFAYSLARGQVNDWMAIYSVFISTLAHSGMVMTGWWPVIDFGCVGCHKNLDLRTVSFLFVFRRAFFSVVPCPVPIDDDEEAGRKNKVKYISDITITNFLSQRTIHSFIHSFISSSKYRRWLAVKMEAKTEHHSFIY